jgi:HD-like signal output (HDOD) protein
MGNIWKRLFLRVADADVSVMTSAYPDDTVSPKPVSAPEYERPKLLTVDIEDHFYRLVLSMPAATAVEMRLSEAAMLNRLDLLCGADRFDIGSLPRLPAVLPQLLLLLRSDDADGAKLSKLIGRDPVLVGEVMRVSKSVHYRTLQPIASLQHAVVLLGQDGLRRMVTQHVMKPILQASAGMLGHAAGQRLWDHAERCSHACMFMAKGQSDPFEAYLAGIVCNAGVGAMVRVLDQEVSPDLGVFSREFLASCARLGSHLSLRAAQQWELPKNVVVALEQRINSGTTAPSSALGRVLLDGDQLAMIQLIADSNPLFRTIDAVEDRRDGLALPLLERAQKDLQRAFRSWEA